jgi:hypothetical protein
MWYKTKVRDDDASTASDWANGGPALLLQLSRARVARVARQRWHVLASYDAQGALVRVEFIDAVTVSRLPLRLAAPRRVALEASFSLDAAAANDPAG